jgi:UDP-glucose 4-epimerase
MKDSSKIAGKKVLVTGASGFIGYHLCNRLLEHGAEVHGISRKISHGDDCTVHWWQGDLTELEFVRNIFTRVNPDFIFHLASHVSGSRDIDMIIPMFQNNLTTTVNLLTVAAKYGCQRIILAGSMEEPASVNKAIPSSPYAAAKWAGSGYAHMFYALYKTPVVIARIFMVYGPGQKDLKKLVPYVTLSFLNNQIPKLSSGTRQVDWIYVQDVIDGLLAMIKAPDIEGHTIDAGSGSLTSIRTVVEHLKKIINPRVEASFGALSDRPLEQVRIADISNTYSKTGWKPKTSLEKGLTLTVDWYREHYITSETETTKEKVG